MINQPNDTCADLVRVGVPRRLRSLVCNVLQVCKDCWNYVFNYATSVERRRMHCLKGRKRRNSSEHMLTTFAKGAHAWRGWAMKMLGAKALIPRWIDEAFGRGKSVCNTSGGLGQP